MASDDGSGEIGIVGLIEAEIWCGLIGGCVRGPGEHLFDSSCWTPGERAAETYDPAHPS